MADAREARVAHRILQRCKPNSEKRAGKAKDRSRHQPFVNRASSQEWPFWIPRQTAAKRPAVSAMAQA